MALAAIYQSNPEDALFFIAEKGTKKEVWNMLKTMHLGTGRVKNAKVQTLRSEFEALRMKETENIDDFTSKVSTIVKKV